MKWPWDDRLDEILAQLTRIEAKLDALGDIPALTERLKTTTDTLRQATEKETRHGPANPR